MRKNSFLTFCFAFIPGGGEMYLGMMKKGLALMLTFWGVCAVSWLLQIEFLFWLLPVVWFYSFFETLNCQYMTESERNSIDGQINFRTNQLFNGDLQKLLSKRYMLVGGGLIFLGFYLLFANFVEPTVRQILERMGYDFWIMRYIVRMMPSLLVSVLIILLGIHLVKGKKKPPAEDDYVMFKGGDHE